MALVSISDAARLAGISRTHLYKKYLAEGILSKTTDEQGNSVIDTAEILRVFGKLHGDSTITDEVNMPLQQDLQTENTILKAKIEMMERLLAEREARINDLKDSIKLIGHDQPKKKRFWFW
jgi:AraC-like DNA-binding protein